MITTLAADETPGGGHGVARPSVADHPTSTGAVLGGPLDWRAMGSRPISTLVTHAPPGRDVVHFPATPPAPQASRPSVLSPEWRARPELERPPSPDELAVLATADVAPAALEAMRSRARRSVLEAEPREHAPYAGPGVPVLVRDPTPVRTWETPAASSAHMPARERASVLDVPSNEERRGTPCLYERERP